MSKTHIQPHQKEQKAGLGDLIMAFRRIINQCIKKDFSSLDLTLTQLEVLMFIGPTDMKTMESIAGHLKITPPSATALIEKMEAKKIVQRKRDTDDRRMVYIELTSKTKKQLISLKKQREKIFAEMVARLSPTDRKHLERIIGILIQN